ncbi:MAG: DUF6194 family protein [Meiothermus sp.]|nr:DUF6194 family protein [Meiothermus sp.]
MDEAEIIRYITETFDDVRVVGAHNAHFFFLDPEQKFPFVTLVTDDTHDQASDLSRPGVFRLNIGVGPEAYRSRFGPQPAFPRDGGVVNTGHDFTALDQLMPHPVYAAMSWVCVLNRDKTLEEVKALLAEAYALDAKKHVKRKADES